MEAVSLTKLTKQKTYMCSLLESLNDMPMNDTKKTKTAEMWEYPNFIYD